MTFWFPMDTSTGGGSQTKKLWVQGHYNHVRSPRDSTNQVLMTDSRYALFAYYIKSLGVYHCPSDRTTLRVGSLKLPKLRSYSMNWYMGYLNGGFVEPPNEYRFFRKTHDLQAGSPAKLFVFTDVHPDSICWPLIGVAATDTFFMFPASYHNRAAVLAFADGHAEHKKWRDGRTYLTKNIDWHQHNFSAPRSVDLAWLREHASVTKR